MNRIRGEWFASNILVHEPLLRQWLRRFSPHVEADDIVQETYAKIAAADYAAIKRPKSFMFTVAHNIVIDTLRSRQIVPLGTVADLDALAVVDMSADQEHRLNMHEEIVMLQSAIAALPSQCRQVLTLRKIEGLSQRDVAERMGLSESTIEKHVAKGVLLCSKWFAESMRQTGAITTLAKSRRRPARR